MKRRTIAKGLAVAAAVAVASLIGVSTAEAKPRDPKVWAIEKANPGISEEVLQSLPDVVKDSDVQIADDFVPNTPIYYPDGTLVPGQSTAAIARAAACSENVSSAIYNEWGAVITSCHSIFGSPGLKVTYAWQATSDSIGIVRVQGFQMITPQPGRYDPYWKSNGRNTGSEVIKITVTWGNVLANLKAQGKSLTAGPVVFSAHFWH